MLSPCLSESCHQKTARCMNSPYIRLSLYGNRSRYPSKFPRIFSNVLIVAVCLHLHYESYASGTKACFFSSLFTVTAVENLLHPCLSLLASFPLNNLPFTPLYITWTSSKILRSKIIQLSHRLYFPRHRKP